MAPVIEFYIPSRFHKRVKWIPQEQRDKLLEFSTEIRKSAQWEVEDVDSSYPHLASLTFDVVARDPIVLKRNEGAKISRAYARHTRSREIILLTGVSSRV
jgi:hypothetical protein